MKKFDVTSLLYVSALALYGLYLKGNYDLFKNYLAKTEKRQTKNTKSESDHQ